MQRKLLDVFHITSWPVTDVTLLTLRAKVELHGALDLTLRKLWVLHTSCTCDSQNRHHDFHNY